MNKKGLFYLVIDFLVLVGFSCVTFASPTPRHGGILNVIMTNGPQMLSYVPMMGPGDHSAIFPAGERLVDTTLEKTGLGVEPVLAERFEEDLENLTLTWYIRKGVLFHDGSELTADVVRWNFQQNIDAKTLPYLNHLKGMRTVDKYTLVMDLNSYNNQLLPSWGWWPIMLSKVAWDRASGGDMDKGKEWARTHIVGTGPFMLEDFKRDVHIKWRKNPNYWRKGRPYLDGMDFKFIPDPVTSNALFLAGEADVWAAPAKDQVNLIKQGFNRQHSWPALGFSLWFNTATGKRWQDKTLREAVELAIDKEAITKAVGFGLYKPLKALPPEGEWGYDADYNPRPYNPRKAKIYLEDAGYPKGLSIKLMLPVFMPEAVDVCTAIKQYLEEVGIKVRLDTADPGRFFGSIYWTKPPEDLDMAYWITGRDTNYLMTYYRWFSTEPFTDVSLLKHTPEQYLLDKTAWKTADVKEQEIWAKIMMRYITDNAMIVPIFDPPAAVMQHPYVHSTQYEQGFVRWQTEEVWMEKH